MSGEFIVELAIDVPEKRICAKGLPKSSSMVFIGDLFLAQLSTNVMGIKEMFKDIDIFLAAAQASLVFRAGFIVLAIFLSIFL